MAPDRARAESAARPSGNRARGRQAAPSGQIGPAPLALVLVQIERVVIAGGGLAGSRAAAELRAKGYAGQITMLGAEPHPPYDRPPLSKKLMMGELDSTSLDTDAAALRLDLRLGEAATGLAGQAVRSDRGEYRFDRLIVATGAAPVRLPGPGRQHVLRTLDDALDIRARLRQGTRLAIVGAGWIGAELATAAVARGLRRHRPGGGRDPGGRGPGRGGRGDDGALVRRGRRGPAARPAGGVGPGRRPGPARRRVAGRPTWS